MKIDISFRDLNETEAAAILSVAKDGGAKLSLFLASPGKSALEAGPSAVAAATGSPAPAATQPSATQESTTVKAVKEVLTASTSPDLEKYSRYPTTKAVVKALIAEGLKDAASILARCHELRATGIAPLKAVPEDQFDDRVTSACMTLLAS